MKPRYAIAALAAAGITALGGTAAVAATASHKPASTTVIPVSGKPRSFVRGTAKRLSVVPTVAGDKGNIVLRGSAGAVTLTPVSGKPRSFVRGTAKRLSAVPTVAGGKGNTVQRGTR